MLKSARVLAVLVFVLLVVVGCSTGEPTATPVPLNVVALEPTEAGMLPTATPVPRTPTPAPPTATPVPPTDTPPVPSATPTAIPPTAIPPTATPEEAAQGLTFTASDRGLGSGRSWRLALGDLDGDGDLDAFVANEGQPGNVVWLNEGGAQAGTPGTFANREQSLGSGSSVALGDLDGDGDLDAVVTHWEVPGKVWLNDGSAAFTDSGQSLGSGGGWDVVLGDLDGDGDLDAFFAEQEANTVWLNDGGGALVDSGQRLGTAITASVVLGDLDGDGDLDALAGGWGEPATVWLNDGTGAFAAGDQTLTEAHAHVHDLALGDLDGDGDLDAFIVRADGNPNEVWLNGGAGIFRNSRQRLGSPLAHGIALGDLDGDGDLDAVTAHGDPGAGSGGRVWLNDGGVQGGTPGRFTESRVRLGGAFGAAVELGDLDGDGDLDAFVAHTNWQENSGGLPNRVWLNETPGAAAETEDLRITILYDNIVHNPRLRADWGFAALVEYRGHTLLFDTGGNPSILMGNMERLEIDPMSIEAVVLSHSHGDHVGGLAGLARTDAHPPVYVPPSFRGDFKQEVRRTGELVEVEPGQEILPGILTTGELGVGQIPEQALVIQLEDGIVVVTGCAHPGIVEMVARARELSEGPVLLVLGGFHLGDLSASQIRSILADFRRLGVEQVAPTHCTGERAIDLFAASYGDSYVEAGTGRVIVFESEP